MPVTCPTRHNTYRTTAWPTAHGHSIASAAQHNALDRSTPKRSNRTNEARRNGEYGEHGGRVSGGSDGADRVVRAARLASDAAASTPNSLKSPFDSAQQQRRSTQFSVLMTYFCIMHNISCTVCARRAPARWLVPRLVYLTRPRQARAQIQARAQAQSRGRSPSPGRGRGRDLALRAGVLGRCA